MRSRHQTLGSLQPHLPQSLGTEHAQSKAVPGQPGLAGALWGRGDARQGGGLRM